MDHNKITEHVMEFMKQFKAFEDRLCQVGHNKWKLHFRAKILKNPRKF